MPIKKSSELPLESLAPDARPALEALGPERSPRRVSRPVAQVKGARAVQRLRDGAGHGGAWDTRELER